MAKLIRLLSVGLIAGTFLVPFNAPPAAAQEPCTITVLYFPPHSPGFNPPAPVDCENCPEGVTNWVQLYNGVLIVYTCHFR